MTLAISKILGEGTDGAELEGIGQNRRCSKRKAALHVGVGLAFPSGGVTDAPCFLSASHGRPISVSAILGRSTAPLYSNTPEDLGSLCNLILD
jgi:hypothetical protein